MISSQYPRMIVSADELYGKNQKNLIGFQLDESGILTADSGKARIRYKFGEKRNILSITANISYVGESTGDAKFYLLPKKDYQRTAVKTGEVSVLFAFRKNVKGIRLDLASQEGNSLKIEYVVLNSRKSVLLICTGLLGLLYGVLLLMAIELHLWRHSDLYLPLSRIKAQAGAAEAGGSEGTARSGTGRKRMLRMSAIFLQFVLILLLVIVLIRNGLFVFTDDTFLFRWLLLYCVQILCVLALWIRVHKKQQSLLSALILVPFWVSAAFAILEMTNLASFSFENYWYLWMNLCCLLIPALALLFLLRRPALVLSILTLVVSIFGIVNHYYGELRGNPLEFTDIAQAGTAANVISNYEFALDCTVLAVLLAAASLFLCLLAALGSCRLTGRRLQLAGYGAVVVASAAAFCLNIPDFNITQTWGISAFSAEYGYLFSFVCYAKASVARDKPEEYSVDTVNEILEAYRADSTNTAGTDPETDSEGSNDSGDISSISSSTDIESSNDSTPNIIVIMNESFADLPTLFGFETNVDALPNLHAMEGSENVITGSLLVSVFGGGTANTEYEFLTGNSLYCLPVNCNPYVQYLSGNQQSVAWHLQALGYSTAGYHPFSGNGYKRNTVYPLLGLSPFYSIADDLPHTETLRNYPSDSTDFQNVIYLYENREEDQPFFIFNVTIQNHGGYTSKKLEASVIPTSEELQIAELEQYLTLIHESDAAFAELVDYFSQVEEDTIILMFGDHQPGLGSEAYAALDALGAVSHQLSTFILWANFDIDEAAGVLTSPNYLRSILLKQAGVELTAYESYLLDLMEEYPAMNMYGYYDSDGAWHDRETAETGSPLWEYSCLVYNNVFDRKNMTDPA